MKGTHLNRKIPSWHREFQEALKEIMIVNCLNCNDILPFLTATLVGQFAISGYSEEFVKKTLERLFIQFQQKRKEHNDPNITR